jgi:hypothetical protein
VLCNGIVILRNLLYLALGYALFLFETKRSTESLGAYTSGKTFIEGIVSQFDNVSVDLVCGREERGRERERK